MICSKCGRENPDDSIFCNKCGNRFPPQEGDRALSQEPRRKCPNCGAWNPIFVTFCQNCAKEIPAAVFPAAPERYCAWCGAGVMLTDISCPRCGHDPTGPPTVPFESPPASQKPAVAGVLMVGSGLLDIISAAGLLSESGSAHDLPIDISGALQFCSFLAMFFGLMAIFGSFFSFQRRHFALALICAALGMIGLGPFALGSVLGLIAMIVLALARYNFVD